MSTTSSDTSSINGSVKDLAKISLPVMFFAFFETISLFIERVFLSYISVEAVHGALYGFYMANVFQLPLIAVVVVAQTFIGYYYGEKRLEKIGPCVWQLIWFSLLTILITVPIAFIVSSHYFVGTPVKELGRGYFLILSICNFLFPLEMAFMAFYLGRGKTLLVTFLSVAACVIQVGLTMVLTFGLKGFFSGLSVNGAAFGKVLSLLLINGVFLGCFLSKKNRKVYQTNQWAFSLKKLWHYVRPGLLRGATYLGSRISWAGMTTIFVDKGGRYLDVMTVGGTLLAFLVFIPKGVYKAALTVSSQLVGAGKKEQMWKFSRTIFIYVGIITALLAIPLILFPNSFLSLFDVESKKVFLEVFGGIKHWLWLHMFAFTVQMAVCAMVIAFKDAKFQLYCYLLLEPMFFSVFYFGFAKQSWDADRLWLFTTTVNVILLSSYFLVLRNRKKEKELISSVN